MDNVLHKLFQLTLETVGRLKELKEDDILHFVERREELVSHIMQQEKTDSDQVIINEILKHDEIILSRMNFLKNEAMLGLKSVNAAKASKGGYLPYTQDSWFLDVKK